MENRTFTVSVGASRTATKWKRVNYTWPDFVKRCTETTRTDETAAGYAAMSKARQGEIKDVGGFVAGSLNGERRKKENVISRSMLTLDMDFVAGSAADLWDEIDLTLGCAALVYTYALGETANGLIIYDDGLWAYSNHGTDPAGGGGCRNAFDLVRIHKFGSRDVGSRADDVTRLPSYKAMRDFAAEDGKTKIVLSQMAAGDFADVDFSEAQQWRKQLEYRKNGELPPTARNFRIILENDPELRGRFWLNELSCYIEAGDGLPWRSEPGQWVDADDACLRNYLDERYKLSGKDKLRDAFTEVAHKNKRHPVRAYLDGLQWDGRERLDTVIISLLGARETAAFG